MTLSKNSGPPQGCAAIGTDPGRTGRHPSRCWLAARHVVAVVGLVAEHRGVGQVRRFVVVVDAAAVEAGRVAGDRDVPGVQIVLGVDGAAVSAGAVAREPAVGDVEVVVVVDGAAVGVVGVAVQGGSLVQQEAGDPNGGVILVVDGPAVGREVVGEGGVVHRHMAVVVDGPAVLVGLVVREGPAYHVERAAPVV